MKNNSARKKLIPAAAMLAISAAMLSTATYAWFTMNKQVEVTGINMTAKTPEGIQISLGYEQSKGTLKAISSDNGVGLVQAPDNSVASQDWTNSVIFSKYYQSAKLIPASSTSGETIYSTEDATEVGKTVSATGTSFAASTKAHGTTGSATIDEKATLKLISSTTVEPLDSSTQDVYDGYYVDYPVWIRSSEKNDVELTIKATVSDGTYVANNDTNQLYKAARVSILTGANMQDSEGVIIPYDGTTAQTTGKYYADGKALAAAATLGTQGTGAAYGTVDAVKQTGETDAETIITVPGTSPTIATTAYSTGNCSKSDNNTVYGNAVCVIVRVWLEGEDEDCWNATAGQDFNIALEFSTNG